MKGANRMKLRIIGCAGGYPMGDNGTSSYLLSSSEGDYHVLLDAGSGSALAIEKYLDVNSLDAVVLSHDHPDHVADIGIYQHLFLLKKPAPKQTPIPIYHFPDSGFAKFLADDGSSLATPYQPNSVLELGPFSVTFLKTVHPLECYAMRILERETGKVIVYTADSGWTEAMIAFASGANLLIADCNFPNEFGQNDKHFTAEEVAKLANEAKVKTLVPTHLPPQADRALIIGQVMKDLDKNISLIEAYPGALYEV